MTLGFIPMLTVLIPFIIVGKCYEIGLPSLKEVFRLNTYWPAVLVVFLVGCVSGPQYQGSLTLPPSQLVASPGQGSNVTLVWGGVIINSENLADSTRLTVLSYPLNRSQKPDLGKPSTGRFIAVKAGYLENADYASQRRVTIQGKVVRVEHGKVGDADYDYPLVHVDAITLWPTAAQEHSSRSRVNFGLGVVISN